MMRPNKPQEPAIAAAATGASAAKTLAGQDVT
jgi:hypothetical protein